MKHTDQPVCKCGPKCRDLWGHEGSFQDTLPNYWTMRMHVRLYKMACAAPWSPKKETNPGGLPHWENVRAPCPENAIRGDVQVMREFYLLNHGNTVCSEVRQGLASLGFKLWWFEEIPLTPWASFFSHLWKAITSQRVLPTLNSVNVWSNLWCLQFSIKVTYFSFSISCPSNAGNRLESHRARAVENRAWGMSFMLRLLESSNLRIATGGEIGHEAGEENKANTNAKWFTSNLGTQSRENTKLCYFHGTSSRQTPWSHCDK